MPFSAACERNKEPILAALRAWLPTPATVLEIGSGTGQHGAHFCEKLPRLRWQPSERPAALEDLRLSLRERGRFTPAPDAQLLPPVPIDVDVPADWPNQLFQAVFTANTLHIMAAGSIPNLLNGSIRVLGAGGLLLIYGPFHDGGRHISTSNEAFDAQLRAVDPRMGVRDAERLISTADRRGLRLADDKAMPANNRLLVFELLEEAAAKTALASRADGIDQPG